MKHLNKEDLELLTAVLDSEIRIQQDVAKAAPKGTEEYEEERARLKRLKNCGSRLLAEWRDAE